MRNLINTLVVLLFLTSQVQSQSIPSVSKKICVRTQQFLATPTAHFAADDQSSFVISQINNNSFVNAFIKVNEELSPDELIHLGVIIGTKAGNIWTVKIPIASLTNFISIEKGINVIELDQAISSDLAAARSATRVDDVHNGYVLARGYSGKDVVVGILDVGFDYTHPTFYSEDGSRYRVKRIWEQKSTGTPPASYSYGHELTDSAAMLVLQSDRPDESHGAHVAGIAAGSGYGGNGNEFRGIAYESDIVLIGITPAQSQWVNTGMTDIVDGLNYIFQYAEAQGKPAVANLSWGCSIGPHDGSSLFSQAVDNLTGPGKIFTVSAGNNGERNLHLHKEFSDSDTLLRSFINWNSGFPERKTWIDVWGESGENFCVDLRTYKGPNVSSTTNFICSDGGSLDTILITSNGDSVFVNLTANIDALNGKPHAFFDIYSQTNDLVAISVKASSGSAHVWMGYVSDTRGYYNEFVTFGFPEASTGDNAYTVGEMACTKSAIAVGAYASKINFTNIAGQGLSYATYVDAGDIVPFSSHGPTTDGRHKPDITAPGLTLASAVNSFDADYLPGGSSYNSVVHQYTDPSTSHDYYYGESSGTSMSAPMAAGIIALLLEEDPMATPEEIKSLFELTASRDEFTTPDPDPNVWGPGKINAYAAMSMLLATGTEEHAIPDLLVYPNPTSDVLHINAESAEFVQMMNALGLVCFASKVYEKTISISDLEAGIYFMSVYDSNNKRIGQQRIIKL